VLKGGLLNDVTIAGAVYVICGTDASRVELFESLGAMSDHVEISGRACTQLTPQ